MELPVRWIRYAEIGAHARSLDLTLVTNNRREFDRMPGLKVENWV